MSAAAASRDGAYSFQTFMDAGWVAGRVKTSRRREVLSFSHHKEVAALPPAAQDVLPTRADLLADPGPMPEETTVMPERETYDPDDATRADLGIWHLTIRHDDTCPTYRRTI